MCRPIALYIWFTEKEIFTKSDLVKDQHMYPIFH